MRHNPYGQVNWGSAQHVKSFSHMHVINQSLFEWAYGMGYRHFPVTHYKPSKPMYPLSDYFTNIPDDVLGAPNTEKLNTKNIGVGHHFNGLGSFAEGHGHEDLSNPTHTWQEIFNQILNQLQFREGGGITINHESDYDITVKMLDYDSRVLGMEIYNDGETAETMAGYERNWDKILSTGRKCFGFSVIDWILETKKLHGSNMLLVPGFTEWDCLKAYRDGSFYGVVEDVGLRFTNLTATSSKVSVGLNRSATIKFITNKGVEKTVTGTTAEFNPSDRTYVRVDVQEGNNPYARIFSNPIMYKDRTDLARRKKMIRNLILMS